LITKCHVQKQNGTSYKTLIVKGNGHQSTTYFNTKRLSSYRWIER